MAECSATGMRSQWESELVARAIDCAHTGRTRWGAHARFARTVRASNRSLEATRRKMEHFFQRTASGTRTVGCTRFARTVGAHGSRTRFARTVRARGSRIQPFFGSNAPKNGAFLPKNGERYAHGARSPQR